MGEGNNVFNRYMGKVVFFRDSTGYSFEGEYVAYHAGLIPKLEFKKVRQFNWINETESPQTVEAWEVGGDFLLNEHCLVSIAVSHIKK